jgi:hypothetical protein
MRREDKACRLYQGNGNKHIHLNAPIQQRQNHKKQYSTRR